MTELTEMGEAPKAETEAIYAWAFEYDDPTTPTSSRRSG